MRSRYAVVVVALVAVLVGVTVGRVLTSSTPTAGKHGRPGTSASTTTTSTTPGPTSSTSATTSGSATSTTTTSGSSTASGTGSDSSTSTTSATGSTRLSVSVAGNRLIDASGAPVRLLGVNRSGTQYACVEGWGIFDGPADQASVDAIRAWGTNAVRVSLNEQCWLGINGLPTSTTADSYRKAVTGFVDLLNHSGLYVVLDLHWNGPGTTKASDQLPMADRDHAPAFWASVAATFKDHPAVLFDLYNEPFPDSNHDTDAAWKCVRDGGTCPGVTFTAAGSQEMLDAVRGAGAKNVVLVGGPQYAGTLTQWTTYRPRDPAGQLAASVHIYYNTPGDPEWSPCYLSDCWTKTIEPLSATTPVVIGEVGEHDCASGLVAPLLSWADSHGLSYLGWSWITGKCAEEPALISNYDGTPTAYGAGLREHLLEQSSSTATTTQTTPPTTPGG